MRFSKAIIVSRSVWSLLCCQGHESQRWHSVHEEGSLRDFRQEKHPMLTAYRMISPIDGNSTSKMITEWSTLLVFPKIFCTWAKSKCSGNVFSPFTQDGSNPLSLLLKQALPLNGKRGDLYIFIIRGKLVLGRP